LQQQLDVDAEHLHQKLLGVRLKRLDGLCPQDLLEDDVVVDAVDCVVGAVLVVDVAGVGLVGDVVLVNGDVVVFDVVCGSDGGFCVCRRIGGQFVPHFHSHY